MTEELIGYSNNLSVDEAVKDALAKRIVNDPQTDYWKYIVMETGIEIGGWAELNRVFVKLKRVDPK